MARDLSQEALAFRRGSSHSVNLAYGFLDFSINGVMYKFSRKEILREPYEESLRIYNSENLSIKLEE